MLHGQDTSQAQLLVPGARLGDVRLTALVGEGISSEVFSGQSLVSGKPCAIKIFRPELGVRAVGRGRYAHLAMRANQLGTDAITQVFSCAETPDGRTYAVMALADGESISALVRRQGPLPRRTCACMAAT